MQIKVARASKLLPRFEFKFELGKPLRNSSLNCTSMESGGLKCSCTVAKVNEVGEVLHKQLCKSAILELGRNEVEDVVLKLSYPSGPPQGPFTVREHSIHKRFLKEGKASIILRTQRLQLFIFNSPPYQLKAFLQSLSIKLAARGKLQGSHRRMLGDISLKFNEISPLNENDLENAKKAALRKAGVMVSPVGPGRSKYCKENATTPHRQRITALRSKKRNLSDMASSSSDSCTSTHPAKKPVLFKNSSLLPLSAEQVNVLELVKNGESVFFTGSAGTGKSYLLKHIVNTLPPDTTFPTASTGAAACLIGGTTLHSFAGIGSGNGTLEKCITLACRDQHATMWKKCRCLVIDEVSMIDADLFDKIEAVARAVRNSKKVFGGIQLVLCGDFLQLPPVSKECGRKQHCFQVLVISADLICVHLLSPVSMVN